MTSTNRISTSPPRFTYRTIAALLALCVVATACYDTDAWPTIHGDARNSDTAPFPGHDDLDLVWDRDFPGAIAAAATIDGEGRVYVTATGTDPGCHLFAIDLETGVDEWCTAEVNRWAVSSSVLIDIDGNLFVGDDEAMHSFDRDGNLRWETPIVGAPISAQFLLNSHLIFVTHIGQVVVLDRANGTPIVPVFETLPGETYTVGDGLDGCLFGGPNCPSANTLAVDMTTGRFYITLRPPGANAAELRALQFDYDTNTISELWSNATLGGGTATSPVISPDGTRVYVNDNDGNFHALDALTGAVIWTVDMGFAPAGSPSVDATGRAMPAGAAGSELLALQDNGPSGTILWSDSTLTNLGIPVQVDDDVVYALVRRPATTLGVDILSVDGSTGAVHDREQLPSTPLATVGTSVSAEGRVVVVGLLGQVYAFDAASTAGATVVPGQPAQSAPVEESFDVDALLLAEGIEADIAECVDAIDDLTFDITEDLWGCVSTER
ncbi:MAG: PQQ-binding-like beta-propeller repeat protein [Acidimicrobiales bacterium]